ncbi:conserved hypothetical protein [Planktothrix serta PCC 8927]|uniref:DUF4276 family protein n=1 Tax=Planktothrix serta PCC 8927 TaxID=671068 RepID=A0A7Z9DVK9_9CYAN|nr:hypothetical protein [Planktothrix serta]VXD10303.1 conserved hypothetical protein [Planktothrix serta PCC 8927]
MVVWVFAGGGEAEVRGLIPFLKQNFPGCQFERKTPVRRKPGPKPNPLMSYGRTGNSLIEQIQEQLPIALKAESNQCDLIFVFDDLDCRNPETQRQKILASLSTIPDCDQVPKLIGFAAPELEAWIIADWDNSIAKHPDFRGRHERMRWWLSAKGKISFNNPESFSEYDHQRDCCQDKLSEALIQSSIQDETDRQRLRFSKGIHTPILLLQINGNEVKKNVPYSEKYMTTSRIFVVKTLKTAYNQEKVSINILFFV